MSMETDELLSIARMGIDAEAFLTTPLGKFLRDKALNEEQAALNELIDADPDDAKVNRDIRNRIHVARMFLFWLRDAIEIGREAHRQMKEIEDAEFE